MASPGHFIYWVPVLELLKIFAHLHIYHRNDCTSACIIHFISILVLEDVIGSDVGVVVVFFGPHCTLYLFQQNERIQLRHSLMISPSKDVHCSQRHICSPVECLLRIQINTSALRRSLKTVSAPN